MLLFRFCFFTSYLKNYNNNKLGNLKKISSKKLEIGLYYGMSLVCLNNNSENTQIKMNTRLKNILKILTNGFY